MKQKQQDLDGGQVVQIDIDRIHPSPTNPRKTFDPVKLAELAETLKAQGVLQPVLLRPAPGWELRPGGGSNGDGKGYRSGFLWENLGLKALGGFVDREADGETTRPLELVDGERRFRAAKLAGLEILPAIVRDLTDRQVLEIQLIANEQREDVLPSERAAAYQRLLDSGTPIETIAAQIGKSPSTVRGLIKLRNLPLTAVEALDKGVLGQSTAELIARVPGHEAREKLALIVLSGDAWFREGDEIEPDATPLSFRDVKELIEDKYTRELKQAPFSQSDRKLLPAAGSCKDCPKRTGNLAKEDPEGYAGSRADVCTDPGCYRQKVEAHKAKQVETLKREGVAILDKPSWEMQREYHPLDEECDILTAEEQAALDADDQIPLPTWADKLGDKLDGERVATIDRDGKAVFWVPREKAEALLGVGEAKGSHGGNGQAKASSGQAKASSGPSEWEIDRKASALALGRARESMRQLATGPVSPAAGQLLNLITLIYAEVLGEFAEDELTEAMVRHGIPCEELKEDEDRSPDLVELPALSKWLDESATATQALGLLADLLLERRWSSGWRNREKPGAIADVLRMAAIDVKELSKEAKKALKDEAKAKEKGTKGASKKRDVKADVEEQGELPVAEDLDGGEEAIADPVKSNGRPSLVEAMKGEPIGPLGVTAKELDAAYIAPVFSAAKGDGAVKVTPLQLNGRFYVVTSGSGDGTGQSWDLRPIAPDIEFKDTSLLRLRPGDVNGDWWAGVCVKIPKQKSVMAHNGEWAIASKSQQRRLINLDPAAANDGATIADSDPEDDTTAADVLGWRETLIEDLELTPKEEAALRESGINTVGDLADAIDRDERRVGISKGLWKRLQAMVEDARADIQEGADV